MTHSVYFWLRADADHTAFEIAARKLLTIKSVRTGHIAKTAATPVRPVTEKSFSYYLHLEFDSVAAHDSYQIDPVHDTFVEQCKAMWDKVVIYDTEPV